MRSVDTFRNPLETDGSQVRIPQNKPFNIQGLFMVKEREESPFHLIRGKLSFSCRGHFSTKLLQQAVDFFPQFLYHLSLPKLFALPDRLAI